MSATRLKNKPLLEINNLPIICHVVKKAKETGIGNVIVATEDKEIVAAVEKNDGKAILTGNHKTGTDRIFEAFKKLKIADTDMLQHGVRSHLVDRYSKLQFIYAKTKQIVSRLIERYH